MYGYRSVSIFLPSLAGVAGLGLFLLVSLELLSDRGVFALLTLLLLLYLCLEVSRVRRVHPERWLLNPVVLASFMTFVMGYGFTNLLFFLPEDLVGLVGLTPAVTPAMVKLMWLVLIGAVAMWLGYWSPVAKKLSGPRITRRFRAQYLPNAISPRAMALPLLVLISLLARLIQIRLGVFGYSSTFEKLIEHRAITQYLSLAASLGKLALVIASLQFFTPGSSMVRKQWFVGLVGCEVIFGILSGMKSQVATPFIIAGVCQYLRTGRFSKHWVVLVIGAVVAAYTIIEPFRVARYNDPNFEGTSLGSIVDTILSAPRTESSDNKGSTSLAVMQRQNLTYIGSLGIEFADDNSTLPEGSPKFLDDIFLAPVHAWVPRVVWDNKPLGILGLWYTDVVMRYDLYTSTAMGPFTYLYFAGGAVAVFVLFFLIGIAQRLTFFLFQPSTSSAGGVIFFGMLTTIVVIDSAVNSVIISLCRGLPILLFLQFLIFPKRGKNCVRQTQSPRQSCYLRRN